MSEIIKQIRGELLRLSDDAVRDSGSRFFKEEVKIYGVRTALVTKTAKEFWKSIKSSSKDEVFSLCEILWKSGYMEESGIACTWAYELRKQYTEDDFAIFERWVNNYVSNWAACDTLCNHTVAAFIEAFPGYIDKLKEWARSENRWVKRASAVTLIIPARKGIFRRQIFEIADILLMDNDDLVQKGYGWMLKAASEFDSGDVFEYVLRNKGVMPRTALRYAIEKMPSEMRKAAMSKG